MVNVEQVRVLHPLFHGEHVIILRDGARVTLSRNYRSKLKSLGVESAGARIPRGGRRP